MRSGGQQFRNDGDGSVFSALFRLCQPHVVVVLKIEPQLGSGAQRGPETDGGVWCDAATPFDQVVDPTDRDAGGLCKAILTDTSRLKKFEQEHLARMREVEVLFGFGAHDVCWMNVGRGSGGATAQW